MGIQSANVLRSVDTDMQVVPNCLCYSSCKATWRLALLEGLCFPFIWKNFNIWLSLLSSESSVYLQWQQVHCLSLPCWNNRESFTWFYTISKQAIIDEPAVYLNVLSIVPLRTLWTCGHRLQRCCSEQLCFLLNRIELEFEHNRFLWLAL